MAIKDVRDYYHSMLAQYLEEKQNLDDFAEALKDGLITEEQLQEVTEIVADLEKNYYRLTYIMYLLNMPNRPSKKAGYARQQKNVREGLHDLNADEESVVKENKDALAHFKKALRALKEKDE